MTKEMIKPRYRISFWFSIALALLAASLTVVFSFWHFVGLAALFGGLALLRTICHWEVRGLRVVWNEFWHRRKRELT